MEQVIGQVILLLPEILLAAVAIIIMLLPRGAHKLAWGLAAMAVAAAALMEISLWGVDTAALGGAWQIDHFAVFAKVMLLGLGFISIIGSYDFTDSIAQNAAAKTREYYALLLAAMLGLVILPSATDYITLFIAFELISIATYVLPMANPNNERGFEASLKYFLTGAFSSAIILYGLSLLYGFCGTLNIAESAQVLGWLGLHPMAALAYALLLVGFGYKMAMVPMHWWAADTYFGAPAATTGFISSVTQKGAFIVAMKLVLVTFVFSSQMAALLLGLLCAITMTVGNVLALLQDDVKRMMAYSSVAHAGNIPVGIAVGTALGVAGSFLHILAHGLMTIGAFLVIRMVAVHKGGTKLSDFAGLARQMPGVAAAFMLILLSFGGIPPLLGFWSKMLMVVAAVGLGGWYTVLAVVLVLNSALSLVYYARVIRDMYAKPVEVELLQAAKPGITAEKAAVVLAAVLLLVLGLLPNVLTEWAAAAATALW